jgi:hypothetical protein
VFGLAFALAAEGGCGFPVAKRAAAEANRGGLMLCHPQTRPIRPAWQVYLGGKTTEAAEDRCWNCGTVPKRWFDVTPSGLDEQRLLCSNCFARTTRPRIDYGWLGDDAVTESFFGSLTKDLLGRKSFCIRAARAAVFDYIETCYNAIRLHSTLGYLNAGRVGEDQRRKTANYALSTEAGAVTSTALWTYSPADAPLPSGLVGEGRALVPFAVAGAPTGGGRAS